ncbi:MAG: hypothetical protein MOB07_06325 [Acidobacteria bacterium]|nr:hypothetical protein [Acidobacteriota bacterium]
MANTIQTLARSLALALEPFAKVMAASDDDIRLLVEELGYTLPATVPPSLSAMRDVSETLLDSITEVEDKRLALEFEVEDGAEQALLTAMAQLLLDVGLVVGRIQALRTTLAAELPADYLTATGIAEDMPTRLYDYLVIRGLAERASLLTHLLQLAGIFEVVELEADPARRQPPFVLHRIRWERIPRFLEDPPALFGEVYGWGTPDLNVERLFDALAYLSYDLLSPVEYEYPEDERLEALEVASRIDPDDGPDPELVFPFYLTENVTLSIVLYPLPLSSPGEARGLAVTLRASGALELEVPITDLIRLQVESGVDLAAGVAVTLYPGQPPKIIENVSSGGAASILRGARVALRLVYSDDEELTSLLAAPGGTGVQAKQIYLALAAEASGTGVADFGLEAGIVAGKITIKMDDADSFLASLLPPEGLEFDFDFGLGWSAVRGLYFRGSAALETAIPLNQTIGSVTLSILHIRLGVTASELLLEISVTGSGLIGPVSATVESIGTTVALRFERGNLGPVDLGFRFAPPNGLGFAIDAPGVVGGGFLRFDSQKGEYSGILQLEIAEKISVKAIGLLTTRMPDGSRGYSLVVIIFVEGFAPIQLGFGFALTGIGGLLAINRTFDEESLRAGLKNHMLDSLMFPKDPIRNAPQIISNLNKVFPPANGHHLFGPMVQIAWGTPPLITANLAVVLEFGTRLRLLILAQIEAILPKRENDLVRLQMDAIGVVDFDQGTAELDATLYDSRLLKKFVLTGDMAMRLKWESSPSFALAVGGLHPAFNPPPNFPKLERIAINLSAGDNPRLRCEAYFALTSNTVQFGARAELYAAAAGFSVHGDIGFDVLIQFDPFFFLADFHAQLQLKRGSTNLFKVRLEGALAGPRPLHLKGKATFEILWWDVSIRVDKTLVEGEKPPPPEPIDVLPRLKEALGNPGNWIGQLPSGQRQMVTLRANPGATTDVLLHPLGTLTVKQGVVPLNMDISRFGQAAPAGARRFTISSVSLGGQNQTTQPVRDFFAPAQFFDMSDDEKLSRPSFEPMAAGVSIGSDEFVFSANADDWLEVGAIEFETWIVDKQKNVTRPSDPEDPTKLYKLSPELLGRQARFGAAGVSELRRTGKAKYRTTTGKHRIEKEGWSIVAIDDMTEQPAPGIDARKATTYSEAAQALRILKQENPAKAAGLKILRLSELSEG